MTLFLYDPRTNIKSEISMESLRGLTGRKKSELLSIKAKGHKLRSLNCYIVDESITYQQRRVWYETEKYRDETWKKIQGFCGMYAISNYGRVKSFQTRKWKLLLPHTRKSGYLFINLKNEKGFEEHRIAKLVARHFVGIPKDNEIVKHRNGIKTDCFAGNLEYVDKRSPQRNEGVVSRSKPVVQLNPYTLKVIAYYRSAREAAKECFLNHKSVLLSCHQERETAGFRFMFEEEYENKFGEEAF